MSFVRIVLSLLKIKPSTPENVAPTAEDIMKAIRAFFLFLASSGLLWTVMAHLSAAAGLVANPVLGLLAAGVVKLLTDVLHQWLDGPKPVTPAK